MSSPNTAVGKSDEGPIPVETTTARPKDDISPAGSPRLSHGEPQMVDMGTYGEESHGETTVEEVETKTKGWFSFFRTRNFWIVLVLGQILSLCDTSTNTMSTLLVDQGTSIPAFQSLFNYVLMNIVYTGYTFYKYGFKKWCSIVYRDGWKYFILAFMDVQGNYFTVLAYRYTTILSAQLINFWAIIVVVILSFSFLHVRYHWTQVLGILICCGGMGLLIASDHITGSNGGPAKDQVKGDLFALLGSTFYGLSNVTQEYLVSKRPLYEVVGQLAFWGTAINGTQAGIFDHKQFRKSTWNGKVAGYEICYTLSLFIFYTLCPILFRLASAAFLNISLLTGNFWGVIVGIQVFHLHVHYLYPIAFVMIIVGLFIYFIMMSALAESVKPWLGRNQERGVNGVGTAKRRVEKPNALV